MRAAEILATGAPFAEVHERLAAGRRYTAGAALMGLIGGLLPALRAARMPITRALLNVTIRFARGPAGRYDHCAITRMDWQPALVSLTLTAPLP